MRGLPFSFKVNARQWIDSARGIKVILGGGDIFGLGEINEEKIC